MKLRDVPTVNPETAKAYQLVADDAMIHLAYDENMPPAAGQLMEALYAYAAWRNVTVVFDAARHPGGRRITYEPWHSD